MHQESVYMFLLVWVLGAVRNYIFPIKILITQHAAIAEDKVHSIYLDT
jgi:hypothetical protein